MTTLDRARQLTRKTAILQQRARDFAEADSPEGRRANSAATLEWRSEALAEAAVEFALLVQRLARTTS